MLHVEFKFATTEYNKPVALRQSYQFIICALYQKNERNLDLVSLQTFPDFRLQHLAKLQRLVEA